jgi:hypothetical protein
MRTCLYSFLILVFISCNADEKNKNPNGKKVYYPYAALYTEQYEEGKPELTKKVLEIWRAYDRGNLPSVSKHFAPHLQLIFEDRNLKGKKDSIILKWQKQREGFTYIQSFLDSWLPVKAVPKNEDLVLIWARQLKTDQKGKQSWIAIHQVWRFNADGLILQMQEFVTPVR